MPDERDLDKIEKMIEELGEKELELGEIREEEVIGTPGEQIPKEEVPVAEPGAPKDEEEFQELLKDIAIGLTEEKELEDRMAAAPPEEEELAVPPEEKPEEEGVAVEEEEAAVPPVEEIAEEELVTPIEEITPTEEITEELIPAKPAEELVKAEEDALDLPVDFDMEDISAREEPPEALRKKPEIPEEAAPSAPPAAEIPEEEIPEEAAPSAPEEEAPSAPPAAEIPEEEIPEPSVTEIEEEAPIEEIEPTILGEEEKALEEMPEPVVPAVPEEEIPVEEPSDLLAGLSLEEPEAEEEAVPEEEVKEEIAPEEAVEEEVAPEEAVEEEAIIEKPEAPEPAELEVSERAEKAPPEKIEVPGLGELEIPEEEEKPPFEPEVPEFGELEAAEVEEKPTVEEPEVPSVEMEEEIPSVEAAPGEAEAPLEEIEELSLEELEAEMPAMPEEGAAAPETEPPEGFEETAEQEMARAEGPAGVQEIELSDDDINQIKTKLGALNPLLASNIQEIIVKGTLPAPSISGILQLLIQDAPEEEITSYVERVIGRKIVPVRIPPVVPVVRKPGVLGALAENIAPLVRIAGLFVIILAILSILFMVFVYKPMRANRFYKEGISYVKNEQYEEAESSFKRATRVYLNIKQYDNFGWSYMVSGNYEAAENKFIEGISAEKLKAGIGEDVEMDYIKNLNIHLHLAMLYNILERYDRAEALYSMVVKEKPQEYEYLRMQGENLIDWGRKELMGRDEHYISAYELFSTAYTDKPKNVDALFKMLFIEIMRGNDEAVDSLYDELTRRFPKALDQEVQTELAFHYLSRENFGPIMPILVRVLEKPPGIVFGTSEARDLYRSPVSPGEYRDYAEYFKEASIPKAYFAFAEYYKAVNNRKLQEAFLRDTIDSEEARWSIEDEGVTLVRRGETLIAETLPQHYPWEEKNRILLSDAYNDLGEIYARMETPGMAAEAITNFKKSIDQNPRNVEAYFNLAQVYFYKERNYELARRNYERARALNLIDRDLNYNLGLIYYYRGDFFRALSYWSDLSEEIPDNPYLSSAMGSAFLHLGTYHAALGEFLVLSEVYDGLVKNLGEIKPWRAYHKRILLESSAVNNNLGVAYQKLYEETGDSEYQKNSLLALYKAGELADIMGIDRGKIQYNIQYIIHPEVVRGDMAIHDDLNSNYRFYVQ